MVSKVWYLLFWVIKLASLFVFAEWEESTFLLTLSFKLLLQIFLFIKNNSFITFLSSLFYELSLLSLFIILAFLRFSLFAFFLCWLVVLGIVVRFFISFSFFFFFLFGGFFFLQFSLLLGFFFSCFFLSILMFFLSKFIGTLSSASLLLIVARILSSSKIPKNSSSLASSISPSRVPWTNNGIILC